MIGEGDRLIAIAEDDSRLNAAVASTDGRLDGDQPATNGHRHHEPEQVLILGWNRRGTTVVRELDHYVAPGSTVHVVAAVAEAEQELARESHELEHLSFSFHEADTTDRRAKLVMSTARARKAEQVARDTIADIRAAWADLIGDDEMDTLEAGLRRLRAALWSHA